MAAKKKSTKTKKKGPAYGPGGIRLTDCCAALSTFHDEQLCCKACYRPVPLGQGDGSEFKPGTKKATMLERASQIVAVSTDDEHRAFARYLADQLGPDLREGGMTSTAGDVVRAGELILELLDR